MVDIDEDGNPEIVVAYDAGDRCMWMFGPLECSAR